MSSRWWSGRPGVQAIDLYTRWPLYLWSGAEPLVVLLLIGAQPHLVAWSAAVLLLVTVAHTAVCVALLRAGITHFLGGTAPRRRLLAASAALTLAALIATLVAFPEVGRGSEGTFFVGTAAGATSILICAELTTALTPLLPTRRLLAAIATPAVLLGIAQVASDPTAHPVWALNYFLSVGSAAAVYRPSIWFLGVVWEMERGRQVQSRLAVAEERLRVARDLHDVLGRNLALIAVNSELAAQLVRHGQDGAVERMLAVRQTAQDSMREVREVVGGLRAVDLDTELAGARSLLRSAGISVRVVGDGTGVPSPAQASLGWVVREAATNIIRHSQPSQVTIRLDVEEDARGHAAAVLRIENDGAYRSSPGSGAGHGLIGLAERLEPLGGDISTQARADDHFVVTARVPLTQPSAEPPFTPTSAEPAVVQPSAESAVAVEEPAP